MSHYKAKHNSPLITLIRLIRVIHLLSAYATQFSVDPFQDDHFKQ